jgi:hypothetical protein
MPIYREHIEQSLLMPACIYSKRADSEYDFETYSELGSVGIIWDGHIYLHIVRCAPTLELSTTLHHIFNSTPSVVLHSGLDPYQRLHCLRKAVGHQFKFAVRGYE